MENKKPIILIVEDDTPERKALSDKFIREGFSVLEAKDGKQGLDIAFQHKPDVILLDIIMPVMDGLSTLEKLRQDDWGRQVPVVILSNLSDGRDVTRATQSGVHDYLVKANWKIDDVVERVRDILSNSRNV